MILTGGTLSETCRTDDIEVLDRVTDRVLSSGLVIKYL